MARSAVESRQSPPALLEPKIAKVKDDEAFKKSFLELGTASVLAPWTPPS